ncbi:protamine-like [Teleopsis dalmanni]|uniref:protamine-like n=1 Tax=Teleopsis dalmanni TaxID=139649 RepID=UPI0018CC7C4B|nr:protamine-like [Teleopsis dalmanni]
MSCPKKCPKKKPKPVSSNGFLNFLKEYSKKQCGKSAIQIVVAGARRWNCMSDKNKKKYKCPQPKKNPCAKKKKKCAPKKKTCPKKKKKACPKKKKSCPPKKKSCPKKKKACPKKKKACPKKKKACGAKKPKCTNPGPITNNAYLNYIRTFRRKNCGLDPREIFKKAAKCWCKLTPEQRLRYQKQACQVTTSCRRKNTQLCKCARKSKKKKACS